MIVDKAWLLKIRRRGEELKVPHYASAVTARDGNLPYYDGNLPYIIATCLYSQYWQLFFCGCPLYITDAIKRDIINYTYNTLPTFYLFLPA